MSETSGGTRLSMTSASPGSRRRRVLVCTPFAPRLDARHGGKPPAQLLRRLAERNEVAVLALQLDHDDHVDPAIVERCAYVHEVEPVERTRLRRRIAWSIGLLHGRPPWATDCRSSAYGSALERVLGEWRPDVVEIHLQAMAQYVTAVERLGFPQILVDYDPGSTWADELRRVTRGPRRLARRLEVAAWRRYERATRPQFKAIVVFAERDLASVRPTAGPAFVTRIPLALDVPARSLDPEGADPPTVLFVGSFGHPPNIDGAVWLAESIFPRVVARVPEARLELVGHAPGAEVLSLAGGAVSVHASVPDVTPYLNRAAVVVAPIRIGGSMRGKVLEALAAGKALVATPRAAEGIDAVDGEHLVVADGEDELVETIAALLLDRARRRRLGESARRWAESNLGWEEGVAAFEKLYDAVAKPREPCG
jgi:glycosyltransferase involved in cell wall biosynthesis